MELVKIIHHSTSYTCIGLYSIFSPSMGLLNACSTWPWSCPSLALAQSTPPGLAAPCPAMLCLVRNPSPSPVEEVLCTRDDLMATTGLPLSAQGLVQSRLYPRFWCRFRDLQRMALMFDFVYYGRTPFLFAPTTLFHLRYASVDDKRDGGRELFLSFFILGLG
jgi:hypothetical protein